MRLRVSSFVVATLALAIVATGCGARGGEGEAGGGNSSTSAPQAEAAETSSAFGSLTELCGDGELSVDPAEQGLDNGKLKVFDDYTGVVLDPDEGKRIAHALGDSKAAILRNHGLLTVGHSVDEAAWWFITMERSAQAQLLAQAAGDPVDIDHDTALLTASQVGSHFAGWFSFQPLFEQIIRAQPDLLD